jgi:hypothetical protein
MVVRSMLVHHCKVKKNHNTNLVHLTRGSTSLLSVSNSEQVCYLRAKSERGFWCKKSTVFREKRVMTWKSGEESPTRAATRIRSACKLVWGGKDGICGTWSRVTTTQWKEWRFCVWVYLPCTISWLEVTMTWFPFSNPWLGENIT